LYGEIKVVYCKNHLKYIQTGSEAHQPPTSEYQQ